MTLDIKSLGESIMPGSTWKYMPDGIPGYIMPYVPVKILSYLVHSNGDYGAIEQMCFISEPCLTAPNGEKLTREIMEHMRGERDEIISERWKP